MSAVVHGEQDGLAFEAEDFGFDVGEEYCGLSHGKIIAERVAFYPLRKKYQA